MTLDHFICSSCFLMVCFNSSALVALLPFISHVIINNHPIHCYYYCFEERDLLDRLRVRKNRRFYFIFIHFFSDILLFFMLILTCHFLSAWVTSFSISCRAGMLVKNSAFCFSKKVFMSPLFLKDNFLDIEF